jgi:hypothetical protein
MLHETRHLLVMFFLMSHIVSGMLFFMAAPRFCYEPLSFDCTAARLLSGIGDYSCRPPMNFDLSPENTDRGCSR